MELSGLRAALDAAGVATLLDRGFRGLAKTREHWHAPVGDRRTKDRLSDSQRAFNRVQAGLRAVAALATGSPGAPHAPDRAAARAALASALAIGGAPYLLARLADAAGLRSAYLLVPALLLALAVHATARHRRDPVRVRHDPEITGR